MTIISCYTIINAFMLQQMAAECKCFITYITHIRFNTAVNLFVSRKTRGITKNQMTHITTCVI